MGHRFLDIAMTPAVRSAQAAQGSAAAWARRASGPVHHDRLGSAEAAFLTAPDSIYIASVSADGWPYIQHRGGPVGFLKVLDETRLGFADYRGNRQYITLGNVAGDSRVALFAMDYPGRRRLKLLGRMTPVDLAVDPALAAKLTDPAYPARVERGFLIAVEAFDWNCPQHIEQRFTVAELNAELAPLQARLNALMEENAALRAQRACSGALRDDGASSASAQAPGAGSFVK